MSTTARMNRDWIAAEFVKGIEAERELVDEAKARMESPPDPSLRTLYSQIATADERHRNTVETIATRYGHTPSRGVGGGIGETIGRLKGKVGEMGASPLQKVSHDLSAKANAVHWYTAWVKAFEAAGDPDSARELAAVLAEEKTHLDALQEGLNMMVARGAMAGESTPGE